MHSPRIRKHDRWGSLGCGLGVIAAGLTIVAEPVRSQEIATAPFAYRPAYSWAGAYIGVQAGHRWGRSDYAVTPSSPTLPVFPMDMTGGAVGPYAGYNLQSGPLVAGIEADFAKTWLRSPSVLNTFDDSIVKSEIDWTASVRGRLGYAFGNVMPYIAGGVTFAGVNFPYVLFGEEVTRDNQKTRIGWTAGAGLEYAFLSNLIFRSEYRYTDLGEEFKVPRVGTSFHPTNTSVTNHEIRAGVALKFGDAPAPSIDAALSFANAPPVIWSGLYAGASASFAKSQSTYIGLASVTSYVPLNPSGTVPVAYAGYNFQFGRIVIGLEGDALLSKVSGGGALVDQNGVIHSDFRATSKLSDAWSARGRLGFAFGNFLPYVTAGAAGASYAHTIDAFGQQRSFNERFTSWTAGAGLDYALSDHLILRAEYRYTPYGQATNRHSLPNTVDLTVEEIRAGIAFKL
jgi:outer membrane immunogenic protein